MGQAEIFELLEKEKKPMSREQISSILKEDSCKVSHHLQRMIRHEEVTYIEIDRKEAKRMFGDKAPCRRMRLYLINID